MSRAEITNASPALFLDKQYGQVPSCIGSSKRSIEILAGHVTFCNEVEAGIVSKDLFNFIFGHMVLLLQLLDELFLP